MQFVEDSTEPVKRFGRDITNSCNTQPNASAEKLRLTTNQINHLPGESLTDMLRSFVQKEWNGKVNPADRSEAWKAQCKRLQHLVGKYPLPYASNTEKKKRLRGPERSQAKKRVVMENENGLKLILSGEKKREAALMKGTQTFWKKDQYGDYVYFDEASKRRIDENEYYRRYLRHLKDIGLATKYGHQDICRSPNQTLTNEQTDSELTASKVDVQLANAILTEHERSIQEAEVECWRAIKASLKSYEKTCTKLRENMLANLATLNISEADQVQLKEGHPLLESSEIRTTPPSPENQENTTDAEHRVMSPFWDQAAETCDSIKKSQRKRHMVQLSDRFKNMERRKSLMFRESAVQRSPGGHSPGEERRERDTVFEENWNKKSVGIDEKKKSSKSRRRSMVTNFDFKRFDDEIDKDEEDDWLLQ